MKPTNKRHVLYPMLALSSGLFLAACSGMDFNVADRINYKNSKTINSLEVPPDLSAPNYDTSFAVSGSSVSAATMAKGAKATGPAILPTSGGVQLMRDGNVRWLQVKAPAEAIWPKLEEFWRTMGVGLKRNEPRVGIMETEWAENRAEIPLDSIRKTIGKVFEGMYDAGSRDRFRIHLEKPSAQVTNIFLSHERAEEQVTGTGSKWQYQPAKPELEAELLNRLMVFLQGGDPNAATSTATDTNQTSVSVSMTQAERGQPALMVGGNANDTWVRTGVMLGRIGMSIEDQQRERGVYSVTYKGDSGAKSDQGLFKRLFKSDKDTLKVGSHYQVQIVDSGASSLITVGDADGSPVSPALAQLVLNRLKAEFER